MFRITLRATSVAALCTAAVLSTATLRADEPDSLPLPRAKAPRVLKLPAEPGEAAAPAGEKTPPPVTNPLRAGDPAGAKPTEPPADAPAKTADGKSDAELPRPAGKPGRAPDPAGSKADGAKKDTKKDDAKKEPSPDGRCDDCGSRVCVAKECVPKLEEKEITKVCWDSKCEDFCVPGRSIWCGTKCQKDDCGCWSHDIWKPTCAEVRTRVVPVRKTTKRKVPSVKWKVVERCACCRAKAPCGEKPKPDGQPAPAKADGEGAKKTAALPGFDWPWATWLR